jgi:hypothetical protein
MGKRGGWDVVCWTALALYAALFLLYSQTWAFAWDEGFHLLAAQLILAGKKPYLDFCFPQSPLNAYWNAAWMRVFGQSWRVAHAVAALLTIGAVVLTTDFVARRLPFPNWRMAAAMIAGLATGLNAMVFAWAPLAQAYGICLFTLAAAFRLTVRTVDRRGVLLPAAAGLVAGIAAGSSFLAAAALPALFAWMAFYNAKGSRWRKLAGFTAGAAVPFLPVLWLYREGPRQVWFNLAGYHLSIRKLYWPDATRHDLEVLTSWIDSGQALLLGLLVLVGLLFVARRSGWPRPLRAEFYLSAWLAAGLSLELARAHPTFPQYFLLTVPFLAIPAAVGLYAIGSRVFDAERPLTPVVVVALLFAAGLVKFLDDSRDDDKWTQYERIAAEINRVTPPGGLLFADEPMYFLTRRPPPSGFEFGYSHKIDFPAAERAELHILTEAEIKQQVQAGRFASAYSCEDSDIADYGLHRLYGRSTDLEDCTIFWDLRNPAAQAKP